MKKTLLLGACLFTLALTGCGQNVDGIKQSFAQKEDTSDEHDFSGYTFVVSKEEIEKAEAFRTKNYLPAMIGVNMEGKPEVTPLPKVDIKNSEYDKLVELQKDYASKLVELQKQLEKDIEAEVKEINETIAKLESEIKSLNDSMAEYNSMIAEESAQVEKAQLASKDVDDKMKARLEQFHVEFEKVVVESGLPIDKNTRIDPSRFYSLNSRNCESQEQYRTMYLEHSEGKKSCVVSNISQDQAALIPIVLSYGVTNEELKAARKEIRAELIAAQKLLTQAQIIASNKTDVNVRQVEYKIKDLERKIEAQRIGITRASDFTNKFNSTLSRDKGLDNIQKAYYKAREAYSDSVAKEAFNKIRYDINEFSDENDVAELAENEAGLVVYVFTKPSGTQRVYTNALRPSNTDSFLELFISRPKQHKFDFKISGDDDILKIVESLN